MPAILTHDFFGRDALPTVSAQLGFVSLEEHDAFLLGNQGPDPLFYLVADPRVPASNRVGELMHHARPSLLLASLHDSVSMLSRDERAVGLAYAAGFICHYTLDSTLHPLVYAQEYALCDAGVEGLDRSASGQVHAEIERDLDEMVLYHKTGRTIADYKPYREVLKADDRTLATIDKMYFYLCLWTYSVTLDLDCYSSAVKAFRLVQRLFYTPDQGKARVIAPFERAVLRRHYSLYAAMAHRNRAEDSSAFANADHRPWANPFTGDVTCDSFWDRYEDGLARVLDNCEQLLAREADERVAEAVTGNLNFSGMPCDPDDPVGPDEPGPGQVPQVPAGWVPGATEGEARP